ncbi:hypothetical protein J7337_001761 [Fusarium musae]|uniref:Uncharacterized protein n=1 Tax=Fusarium musae TaxID=1042133 RepID=A0A9P8DU80_9HYPO|nr:hypothetical protein J7337_001761 [Fusarium musae]KAG9508198.1 hypothetical protein J7337_001761 [Fusarium musae]
MAGRLSDGNPQVQVYLSTCVEKLVSSKKRGREAVLTFRPPQHILDKSPEKQQTWWNASSRLVYGTLVCFLAPGVEGVSMLFFQVTNKSTGRTGKDDAESNNNIAQLHGAPSITVKLANHPRDDPILLTKLYNTNALGVFVDFNGVIPDTFVFPSSRTFRRSKVRITPPSNNGPSQPTREPECFDTGLRS